MLFAQAHSSLVFYSIIAAHACLMDAKRSMRVLFFLAVWRLSMTYFPNSSE